MSEPNDLSRNPPQTQQSEALLLLGLFYLRLGQADKAETLFAAADIAFGSKPEVLLLLAQAQLIQSNAAAAWASLQRLSAGQREAPAALLLMARALAQQSKNSEAQEMMARFLKARSGAAA